MNFSINFLSLTKYSINNPFQTQFSPTFFGFFEFVDLRLRVLLTPVGCQIKLSRIFRKPPHNFHRLYNHRTRVTFRDPFPYITIATSSSTPVTFLTSIGCRRIHACPQKLSLKHARRVRARGPGMKRRRSTGHHHRRGMSLIEGVMDSVRGYWIK